MATVKGKAFLNLRAKKARRANTIMTPSCTKVFRNTGHPRAAVPNASGETLPCTNPVGAEVQCLHL